MTGGLLAHACKRILPCMSDESASKPPPPVSVRFSPDDLAVIDRAAAEAGTTRSEWLRSSALRSEGWWRATAGASGSIDTDAADALLAELTAVYDELSALRREVNSIGVNLNQIAKWLNKNTVKTLPPEHVQNMEAHVRHTAKVMTTDFASLLTPIYKKLHSIRYAFDGE